MVVSATFFDSGLLTTIVGDVTVYTGVAGTALRNAYLHGDNPGAVAANLTVKRAAGGPVIARAQVPPGSSLTPEIWLDSVPASTNVVVTSDVAGVILYLSAVKDG